MPGFYADSGERSQDGLIVWEPVTEAIDRARWLTAVYSDATLITQFDGDETDWTGGKILTTLSGWLYGYARALLTVRDDGTAQGPLLPGTISFMAARVQERLEPGNPAHWASLTRDAETRPVRYGPERLDEPTEGGFAGRFLAQLAVPNAQLAVLNGTTQLLDVTTGSTAAFTPGGVRQAGPLRIWDAIEAVWDLGIRPTVPAWIPSA
ncbi:hypothetical protein [Actinomadura bangladeshensis]|uniref:hypothetical protein n=1 Tax=Actinomadura bangladeshensis TaxID=453573 RepID=UPI001944237D|nr:hypothetical protein [Actinomadura bangladeshensis]